MAIIRFLSVLTGIAAATAAAGDTGEGSCRGAALQLVQRGARRAPALAHVEQSKHKYASAVAAAAAASARKRVAGDQVNQPPGSVAGVEDTTGPGSHDLIFSRVVFSNLGGLGPDTSSPAGIRYHNVTQLGGASIDALLTSSGYETPVPRENGLRGNLGAVNLKLAQTVDFTLTFINAGTASPVTLGAFHLSFLDLDTGIAGAAKEELTIGGFDEMHVLPHATITTSTADGRTTFTATEHGTSNDNPTDPLVLSDVQAARTVSLRFPSGLSSVQFSYSVANSPRQAANDDEGRNFFLAGMTQNYFCDVQPLIFEFDHAVTTRNNLGGMGPNLDEPHGLVFGNIAEIDGVELDLMITNMTEYTPKNSAKNGVNYALGIVNIGTNSDTRFKFSFVKHGTDEEVSLEWVYFTIYDLDMGNDDKYEEIFDMDHFATYYMTESSEMNVTDLGGGRYLFKSTKQGTGADNPHDLDALTRLQRDRAVTFLLHEQSGFDAMFKAGPPGRSGRNFLMSGHSAVVYC
jgi:hypothetical protein